MITDDLAVIQKRMCQSMKLIIILLLIGTAPALLRALFPSEQYSE